MHKLLAVCAILIIFLSITIGAVYLHLHYETPIAKSNLWCERAGMPSEQTEAKRKYDFRVQSVTQNEVAVISSFPFRAFVGNGWSYLWQRADKTGVVYSSMMVRTEEGPPCFVIYHLPRGKYTLLALDPKGHGHLKPILASEISSYMETGKAEDIFLSQKYYYPNKERIYVPPNSVDLNSNWALHVLPNQQDNVVGWIDFLTVQGYPTEDIFAYLDQIRETPNYGFVLLREYKENPEP